jgi:hypothetical protein
MTLKEKIQNDLNFNLKQRKELETTTLRMLNAAILNKEKEKRAKLAKEKKELTEEELIEKSQLADEEIIEVLSYEVKKHKEAIFEFEKGKREDLAEKEKKETEVLKKYLPEQLSEEEIKKIAEKTIAEVGAEEIKDMGRVMAGLMPQLKGKGDGSLVSRIVKELLSSSE